MAHGGHLSMKTRPGAYQRIADRYHQFAGDVMAHHPNLHDVLIVGDPASNTIQGFGTWENAAQAAALEDTKDFASFLASVEPDLAEPITRNDLKVLYRLNPRS